MAAASNTKIARFFSDTEIVFIHGGEEDQGGFQANRMVVRYALPWLSGDVKHAIRDGSNRTPEGLVQVPTYVEDFDCLLKLMHLIHGYYDTANPPQPAELLNAVLMALSYGCDGAAKTWLQNAIWKLTKELYLEHDCSSEVYATLMLLSLVAGNPAAFEVAAFKLVWSHKGSLVELLRGIGDPENDYLKDSAKAMLAGAFP